MVEVSPVEGLYKSDFIMHPEPWSVCDMCALGGKRERIVYGLRLKADGGRFMFSAPFGLCRAHYDELPTAAEDDLERVCVCGHKMRFHDSRGCRPCRRDKRRKNCTEASHA